MLDVFGISFIDQVAGPQFSLIKNKRQNRRRTCLAGVFFMDLGHFPVPDDSYRNRIDLRVYADFP